MPASINSSDDTYPITKGGFSNEPLVEPPKKPFWRRGWFIFLVVLACLAAAIIPPLVVYRDRLGGSTSSSSGYDPPFWNGTGPNNNPFGTCFTLTSTAFQPNWKGEETTTWCGAQFNKSSPIFALPLLNMSMAVGANERIIDSNNPSLWQSMTQNWCGAEAKIKGPAGEFDAIFGDANVWTTIDMNMNLFETVKGVPIGTYADPDAAGWMDDIRVCFTGNRTDISNGYPYSY